jgi:rare lipoprotein A
LAVATIADNSFVLPRPPYSHFGVAPISCSQPFDARRILVRPPRSRKRLEWRPILIHISKVTFRFENAPARRAIVAIIAKTIFLAVATFSPSIAAAAPSVRGLTQTGLAACYNRHLVGHRTFSGKRYDPNALTASHATIPVGTRVKLTNLDNGRTIVLVVNDRMSAHAGGGIITDISTRACRELKFDRGGEARVKLEVLRATVTTAAAATGTAR